MGNHFYRPLDTYKRVEMNDPRGYISPYLDANLEGEVENQVFMSKYMRLSNDTNHVFKTRCNGKVYRGIL